MLDTLLEVYRLVEECPCDDFQQLLVLRSEVSGLLAELEWKLARTGRVSEQEAYVAAELSKALMTKVREVA